MRLPTSAVTFSSDKKSKFSRNDDFHAALLIFLNLQEIKKTRYISKSAQLQIIRNFRKNEALFLNFKSKFPKLSLGNSESLFKIRIFMWYSPGRQRAPECWRKGSENTKLPRLDLLCQRQQNLW